MESDCATEGPEVILQSNSIYYWKKSSPWGQRQWRECQWKLLKNGTLIWDSFKSNGRININVFYNRFKITRMDVKEFFNGVPYGVRMVPYIFTLPIGSYRDGYFAVSSLDELEMWVEEFVKIVQAEDTWKEMMRRVRKERGNDQNGLTPVDVVLESWSRFIEAMLKLDEQERKDCKYSNTAPMYSSHHNIFWAMSISPHNLTTI